LSRPAFAAAIAVLAALPAPARAACPPEKPRVLLERFISADCPRCWEVTPPNPAPDRVPIALDWIVPAPPGSDAPLAAAALLEAAPRAAREGRLESNEALTRSHPLPATSALQIEVEDGPGWNGYIGLAMTVRYKGTRPLPKGLSGWLALVERIDAGSEGTPVDRLLVRTVIGPLGLDALAKREPAEHLRAVRLPETGKSERLASVGWVEAANGRVIAVGHSMAAHCPTTR
jgi:hypothetical protein